MIKLCERAGALGRPVAEMGVYMSHTAQVSGGADFSQFGETETVELSKLQRYASGALARSWAAIPHVTHHDEIDVTGLEALRKKTNTGLDKAHKITPVVILIKALADALAAFPQFNASLGSRPGELVLKKYFNIGVAVDTSQGLLVPVVRDVDRKGFGELAGEISELAERARKKGLPMADMSGGCMTLTSLGHIGGTGFTPIINLPEVAILGVTSMQERPFPGPDGDVRWHKVLPVSLSYDHRVINGADAARFVRHLGSYLASLDSL